MSSPPTSIVLEGNDFESTPLVQPRKGTSGSTKLITLLGLSTVLLGLTTTYFGLKSSGEEDMVSKHDLESVDASAIVGHVTPEEFQFRFRALANMDQETTQIAFPPAGTPKPIGSVHAWLLFDNNGVAEIQYQFYYRHLSGPPTGVHFHGPAGPGVNAGVQVNLGTHASGTTGKFTLTDEDVAQLANGLWYINIHTAANPGGEIRGQLQLTS